MRILLVEDHGVVRHGLRKLLQSEGWVGSVAEAATAAEAVDRVREAAWDLVILDLGLPDRGGLECLVDLRILRPDLRVLVLSMHVEESVVLGALRAGARGYVVKSASGEELLAAARAVAGGGTYVHGRVAAPVLRELQGSPPPPGITEAPVLGERQRALLRGLVRGRSNREIAEEMNLSVSSVKAGLRELFSRFGVTDRTRLVVRALDLGLPLEDP